MIALGLLSLRRALPRALLACAVALALACALRRWGASPELARALGPERSAAAAARQGAWTVALALAWPAMLARAAATLPRWRRGDRDWLAARPASPLGFLALSLAAPVAGGLLLAAPFWVAAGAAGDAPAWRDAGVARHAPLALLADRDAGAVTLLGLDADALARGARLSGRVVLLPGRGQGAEVRLEARIAGRAVGAARIAAGADPRFAVELEPLADRDAPARLELAIERVDAGAGVLLPGDSVRCLAPGARAGATGAVLAARLALALAAGCGLALGCGAFLRASLAAGLPIALGLLALASPRARALVPGADLVRALPLVGDGVVPAPPGAAEVAVALALAAAGLALARLGQRAGGGAP